MDETFQLHAPVQKSSQNTPETGAAIMPWWCLMELHIFDLQMKPQYWHQLYTTNSPTLSEKGWLPIMIIHTKIFYTIIKINKIFLTGWKNLVCSWKCQNFFRCILLTREKKELYKIIKNYKALLPQKASP